MSAKIIVGEANGKPIGFDLDILLPTRLLITADSGGGKSWLIRALCEQLFGKVQTIIIDPEGEFATLREKFAFVLVGKGGETPADVRSAGLLSHRLLELRVSAVCDISEMKPAERHIWVKNFLEGLIEAPKNLRTPCVVIVDEAQMFAPENSFGESVAKPAMMDMSTRGRKRFLCLVGATQRLAMLDKSVSSNLQNRLVGPTFEDVNLKRAAQVLSIPQGKEQAEFFQEIKLLEPGLFYALGRAIAKERTLIKVRDVITSHPKAFDRKTAAPPPTPEKIKGLLPQLADLPKEAEDRAKTEAEYRAEIRSLKAQVAAKPKPEAAAVDPKAIDRAIKAATDPLRKQIERIQSGVKEVAGFIYKANVKLGEIASIELPKMEPVSPPITQWIVPPRPQAQTVNGNGDLSGPEQRILNAIAWLKNIGVESPEQTAVAFLAGYTAGGGAFNNPRGRLNQRGLVTYLQGDRIQLTEAGELVAQAPDAPLDAAELQRMVLERLPGPERKILGALLDSREGLSNEELASRAGYVDGGGAYNNPRGRLRSLGLIEYQGGKVIPKPLLFLETA